MAIQNFSTANVLVSVNGQVIDDWGKAEEPYTDEFINPPSALEIGLGGNGVRFDRNSPGRRVTLSLNPGSPQASFLQGLLNSNANITIGKTILGTLEESVGLNGVITTDGPVGRGGMSATDNVFTIEFVGWTQTK